MDAICHYTDSCNLFAEEKHLKSQPYVDQLHQVPDVESSERIGVYLDFKKAVSASLDKSRPYAVQTPPCMLILLGVSPQPETKLVVSELKFCHRN